MYFFPTNFYMSYSYGQYPGENFSNPTTPLTFPAQWETMENEEQQVQQQQQQQQQQQAQQQQQQQAQQSESSSPTGQLPPTPQHIQLEEPTHIVPSQPRSAYDDTPVQLHYVHHSPESRESLRESESRILHLDTSRSSSASTSILGPGPIRRASYQHPQVHPYRRAPSVAPPSRQLPLVRFASVQPSSASMPSPAIPSPAAPSPISGSRLTSFGSGVGSPSDIVLAPTARHDKRRVLLLRTDSFYDPETKKLVVMLEAPGVRKADMRVTLSTCPWNRVRQITVSGISRPVFPPVSLSESSSTNRGSTEFSTIRERQFGEFARTFAVPSELHHEDIEASLEYGVLTIKVPCGIPVDSNPEDVLVH